MQNFKIMLLGRYFRYLDWLSNNQATCFYQVIDDTSVDLRVIIFDKSTYWCKIIFSLTDQLKINILVRALHWSYLWKILLLCRCVYLGTDKWPTRRYILISCFQWSICIPREVWIVPIPVMLDKKPGKQISLL